MSKCVGVTTEQWKDEDCSSLFDTLNQTEINGVFLEFYAKSEGKIWVPGVNDLDGSKQEYQNILMSYCGEGNNGAKCRDSLALLCSTFTREDTLNGPIKRMCGCYLQSDQYSDQIPRVCDTICFGADVPYFNSSQSEIPQTCTTQACIIDNVTIQAQGSSVGNVTFTQICPACGVGSGCRCIINDINLIVSDSRFESINILQNCDGSTMCFQRDEFGNRLEVPCDTYLETFGINVRDVTKTKRRFEMYSRISFIISMAFFGLLIAALIIAFNESETIETKETVLVPVEQIGDRSLLK